jgi:hypothetical protein
MTIQHSERLVAGCALVTLIDCHDRSARYTVQTDGENPLAALPFAAEHFDVHIQTADYHEFILHARPSATEF